MPEINPNRWNINDKSENKDINPLGILSINMLAKKTGIVMYFDIKLAPFNAKQPKTAYKPKEAPAI